jgi:hypothetical protein
MLSQYGFWISMLSGVAISGSLMLLLLKYVI